MEVREMEEVAELDCVARAVGEARELPLALPPCAEPLGCAV